MKLAATLFSFSLVLAASQALAATSDHSRLAPSSESQLDDHAGNGRHYLLDPVELTPVMGFTVINGSAGFNFGANGAYPILENAPLYLEPSLIIGIFSGNTMFNMTGAARYDIVLQDTKVRPFARVGLGPTFQTSGSVAVFNALFGGGILYPVSRALELRAEASLVDIDGNAGIQLTTGLSL